VASLKALVENGYNVVGVITAPDKTSRTGKNFNRTGRKKICGGTGIEGDAAEN
jgi:methionyl-tRNA formyltransferase